VSVPGICGAAWISSFEAANGPLYSPALAASFPFLFVCPRRTGDSDSSTGLEFGYATAGNLAATDDIRQSWALFDVHSDWSCETYTIGNRFNSYIRKGGAGMKDISDISDIRCLYRGSRSLMASNMKCCRG
jgi:hypothetical protein